MTNRAKILGVLGVAGLACSLATATPFVVPTSEGVVVADEHGNRARVINEQTVVPPTPTIESDSSWTSLGPFGGDAATVEASPSVPGLVLAGLAPNGSIGGTLYRSTDGGATWAEVGDLSGESVYDVLYLPSGDILIGTQDDVWRSTDDGATWTQIPVGVGGLDIINDLELDEASGDIYAAGRVNLGLPDAANIVRSTDGGSSWTDLSPAGAVGLDGTGVKVDPNDPNELMATFEGAFGGGAVFHTSSFGATWTDRSFGLTGNPVRDVEVQGGTWYVAGGQLFGGQVFGVYSSTNDGATWNKLSNATWPNDICRDVAIDPDDPQRLLAASPNGLHISTDGGSTWQISVDNSAALSLTALSYDPTDSNRVLLGGDSLGVAASGDDGATIALSNTGIGALDIFSISADPNNGDRLAIAFQALNSGGIYTSDDGGTSWNLESGLPSSRYNSVFFAPDGTLYALNDGPTGGGVLEGVYRQDAPNSWTAIGPDQGTFFESELFAMAFGKNDPDLLIAAGADFGAAGFEPTVWRSTDAGATWTKVYEPAGRDFEDVVAVAIADDNADSLIVASYTDFGNDQTGGAISSGDNGQTWNEASSGLSPDAQGFDVKLLPGTTDTFLFADGDNAANQGLYQSVDGGESWVAVETGISVRGVAIDPNDANNRYTYGFGDPLTRRSDSAGAPLAGFTSGLVNATLARDITAGPDRILLATRGSAYSVDLPSAGCSPVDLSSPTDPGVPDGVLTGADFFEFLNLFSAGDLTVDFSSPTNPGVPDGVLTGADFFEFLNLFSAGC